MVKNAEIEVGKIKKALYLQRLPEF